LLKSAIIICDIKGRPMLYAIAIVITRLAGTKYSLKVNDHSIEYSPESADAIVSGFAEKVREAVGPARYTVYEDDSNDRIILVPESAKHKLTVSTRSKQLKVIRFQVADDASRSEVLDAATSSGAMPEPTAIKPWEDKAASGDIKPLDATVSPQADISPKSTDSSNIDLKLESAVIQPMADTQPGDIVVRDEPVPADPQPDPQPADPTPTALEAPVTYGQRKRGEYRHAAEQVEIIAPAGGVVSGNYYRIGSLGGIAAESRPAGDLTSLLTFGVFQFESSTALSLGSVVYWNNGKISSSGSEKIGYSLDSVSQGQKARIIFVNAF
jgi:predicted RecA/RadA family phage recombinase